jgi:hypothetical protein
MRSLGSSSESLECVRSDKLALVFGRFANATAREPLGGRREERPAAEERGAERCVCGQGMEAPVSNNNPYKRRPQRPPAGDVDQSTWNKGVIVATILAALVVIGAIVWAATSAPHTANNQPPSSTGQSTKPPPKAK